MTKRFNQSFACLLILPLTLALMPAHYNANAAISELFFSKYFEGSSSKQSARDLQWHRHGCPHGSWGYNVQMYINGSATANLTIDLTGTVADGDVFVLAQ